MPDTPDRFLSDNLFELIGFFCEIGTRGPGEGEETCRNKDSLFLYGHYP